MHNSLPAAQVVWIDSRGSKSEATPEVLLTHPVEVHRRTIQCVESHRGSGVGSLGYHELLRDESVYGIELVRTTMSG